jgi:hypothetical protein
LCVECKQPNSEGEASGFLWNEVDGMQQTTGDTSSGWSQCSAAAAISLASIPRSRCKGIFLFDSELPTQ